MLYILLTLRTMFKRPFWFWAFICEQLNSCMVYYFYFLSVFDFVGMLLVGGREFRWPILSVTFYWLYLYLLKTCPFYKFYRLDDQFFLLFSYGAVSFYCL